MQPHVHARPHTHVSVIDVKYYNIIQPQHVKCKQNGGWAKYCAFVLENTERRKPKKCGKLSKACQETTLQILPLQMSCIICIVVDALAISMSPKLTSSLEWIDIEDNENQLQTTCSDSVKEFTEKEKLSVLTLSYIAKQKLNDFASVDLLDLLKLLVLEDNNLHSLTWTTW